MLPLCCLLEEGLGDYKTDGSITETERTPLPFGKRETEKRLKLTANSCIQTGQEQTLKQCLKER